MGFAALPWTIAAAQSETGATDASVRSIDVQTLYAPHLTANAPAGGGHPIGGPSRIFIEKANESLAGVGLHLAHHVSAPVPETDAGVVEPPLVSVPDDFDSLYAAVAAGPDDGGVAAAITLSYASGYPASRLFTGGMPFGMVPSEFASWLYVGGGLDLQQSLYDEFFDKQVVVVPAALMPAQSAGYFPAHLPEGMEAACRKPWVLRWPSPAAGIWQKACATAGVETFAIGTETRCELADAECPGDDNPVRHDNEALTFGGFQPGLSPQRLLMLGQIDAYEWNLLYTDLMMAKVLLDQPMVDNADMDFTPLIDKAPHFYYNAWHQTQTYIELIVNRDVWDSLTADQRAVLRTVSQAAVLETLSVGLERQGAAVELLRAAGGTVSQWPAPLLRALREAAGPYLDERADELAAEGDDSFRRVLDHMRDYRRDRQRYFEWGDAPRDGGPDRAVSGQRPTP